MVFRLILKCEEARRPKSSKKKEKEGNVGLNIRTEFKLQSFQKKLFRP
jgi:hypothetical protein